MALILLALADLGSALPLQELLERSGHRVTWDAGFAQGPSPSAPPGDIVILDGELEETTAAIERWRDRELPPAILLMGRSDDARRRALLAKGAFVASNAHHEELLQELGSALKFRFCGRMSPSFARAAMRLPANADPARILAAARTVELDLVRECLRWHVNHYATATALVDELREQRALHIPEVEVCKRLAGCFTVHRLINSGPLDGQSIGRLLWALVSIGALEISEEPPDGGPAERFQVRTTRQHLRARAQRLQNGTHYDVLEVTPESTPEQVDYAARVLATRFAPEKTGTMDLGNLASQANVNWQQILLARATLMDAIDRANYNRTMATRKGELRGSWAFESSNARGAEEQFRRGQALLVDGEVFKAVSSFASACRAHPNHPVYEASLCWARYRAELTRGKPREEVVKKERREAEAAVVGHRPWPQALVALALLCAADGDAPSARWHLHEALTIDPNLPAARQLLSRLSS